MKRKGYFEYRVLRIDNRDDEGMSKDLMEGLVNADLQPPLGEKCDSFEVFKATSYQGGMLYTLRRWTR